VEAQDILAVTPTHLVVRAPTSCAAPIMLRVRRTVLNGAEVASDPVPFCYNTSETATATPPATATPLSTDTPSLPSDGP
jgi:hypothetical protein